MLLQNKGINAQIKFNMENRRYTISLNLRVLKNKDRNRIFRTEEQLIEFFEFMVRKGIIENASEESQNLITFLYREHKFCIIFSKDKIKDTQYMFYVTDFLRFSHLEEFLEKNPIGTQYQFTLFNYTHRYRIVPRKYDEIVQTIKAHELIFKTYIAQFIKKDKAWFFQQYNVEKILVKIATILSGQENFLEPRADGRPLWLYLNDINNKEDVFLVCISFKKFKRKGEQVYDLLLDNIEKGFKDMALKRAQEAGEEILPFTVKINKIRDDIIKKYPRKTGLKIIKNKKGVEA